MNEGEKRHYDNSVENMMTVLHKTYEQNQEIIKLKMGELESHIDRLESYVKGIKTRLSNETEYLRGVIKDAIATRLSLDTVIEDLDPETIDKIKKITDILVYGGTY